MDHFQRTWLKPTTIVVLRCTVAISACQHLCVLSWPGLKGGSSRAAAVPCVKSQPKVCYSSALGLVYEDIGALDVPVNHPRLGTLQSLLDLSKLELVQSLRQYQMSAESPNYALWT